MTRSCGDTEAGCGSPGTPHRSHSGWATRETPAALPVMPCSSPPVGNRCGPSPQHQTCQQECLQRNRGTAVRNVAWPVLVIWLSWGGAVGLYLRRRAGNIVRMKLHPWWWAGPKARLVSQKPEGSAEPWMGCCVGAWWKTNLIISTGDRLHRRIFTSSPACF